MKHMKSVSTFIAATWGAAFILYLPASVSSSLRASGELAEGRASKFGASNVVSGLEENFPNAKRLSGVKSSPAASAELRADLTAFHLKQPMSLPTEIEVLKTLSDKLCDEKISFSEKLHHVVETFPLMAKNYGEVSMPENLKKEYNSIFDQLRIIAAELVKHRGEADASIDTRLEFGATAMHVLNRIAGSKELPKDTVEEAQVNLSKIAKQNTKPGMRPEFSATFDAYKTPYVNLPPKLAHNLAEYSKNARKAPMEEVTMKFSEFDTSVSPEKYHKRTREPNDTLEKDSHLKPIPSPENYFKRTQESKERLEKDAHLKPRPPGPFPDMGKYKTKLSISIDSLRNLKLKNLDSDFSERFKKIDTKKYLKAKIDFIGEINAHLNEENKLFEIIDELDETINIRSDLPYKYIQNQINYIKAAIAAETMNFAQPKVKVKKLIGDTMKNLEDRVLILETLALSAYLIQMANIDANYLEHLGLVEYYLEQIRKMTSDEEYLHFRDLIIKKLKLVVDHGISPKLKTEDLFPVTKTGYKGTLFGLGEHDASKIATKTENQMGSSQNIASRTAGDFSKTNILPTSQREAKLNNPEAVKRNRQRRTRLPLHHQAKYKGTQLNSDGLLKLNLPPYLASRHGGTLIEAHPLPTPQQEANPNILQKAKRINQQGRVGLLLPQQSKYQGKPFNSDRASKINNQLGAPKYLSLEYGSSSTETHPLPIPHQGSKHHNPRLAKSNNQRGAMLPLPGQNEIKEPFFKHYKSINPISTQRTDKKKGILHILGV